MIELLCLFHSAGNQRQRQVLHHRFWGGGLGHWETADLTISDIEHQKKKGVFTSIAITHTSYVGTYWPLQDADVSNINIQVCVYAFDLLYLNGKVSNVYNLCTAINDYCDLVVTGEGAFSGKA